MKIRLPTDPRARLALYAIAALVAMAIVATVFTYARAWLGDAPAQKAAQSKLDGRVSGAEQETQDAAVASYTNHLAERATIKEREVHYVETIKAAPGASDEMPVAVHDAGIAAIRGLRDASGDNSAAAAPLP